MFREGQPRLTIACVSYNHEKWIARNIESCLMQKIDEPFQIVIYDDKSTDNTLTIIKQYQAKYPNIITIIPAEENLFSKGISGSKNKLYPAVKTEYVITTDGDDYFSDPNKLQKQVNFLDKNPDYSICFHPVKILYEDKKAYSIFPDQDYIKTNNIDFSFEKLLQINYIQTNSCMYRWIFAKEDPIKILPDNILPADHFLHLLHAKIGKIGYLDEVMSVYWKHSKSLWNDAFTKDWYLSCGISYLNFLNAVNEYFQYDTRVNIFSLLTELIYYAFIEQKKQILEELFHLHNSYFLYALIQMQKMTNPYPEIATQLYTIYFNNKNHIK